jgi:nucleotide-binding universal stress UspA family protein
METKVLIAIDLSENSLKAVDYVGKMLSCLKDVDVSLLNVIKELSHDTTPDPAERERHVQQTRSKSLALMEQAARRLVSQGIPEKHIHLKILICRKQVSVADLILSERQKGEYETIVVGRRGVSKREEFLFGSVSNSVVREAKGCAVWVIE